MHGSRRSLIRALSIATAGLVSAKSFGVVAQGSLPDGVPENSLGATVTGYEDGDKYTVNQNGEDLTVLMISANAPESDECFYNASSEHLKKLLPIGTTVYLEFVSDDFFDSKARLLAHTWKPRDGKTAQFIDERMIADGYSHFKSRDGYTKRDTRLKKAEQTAKDDKRGLWEDGACSPPAGQSASAPKPTPTPQPVEEAGTPGFSQGIGQARSEFEARFGEPNEQYSGNGLFYYGRDPNDHYSIIYWQGNVWLFDYSVPNYTMSLSQDLSLAFIPPDSVLQYDSYPYTYKYARFYYSESLASRFPSPTDAPANAWGESTPGIFNVSFNFDEATGLVFEILIGPGERV